jgi:Holliday junction resolvase
MALHRRAAKRDESEPEVVEAFLDAGATVIKHSGKDECDLVIGYRGQNHCVEVKTGNRQPSEDQTKWAKAWRGGPVVVVRNGPQAKALMRKWDEEITRANKAECELEEWERVNGRERSGT